MFFRSLFVFFLKLISKLYTNFSEKKNGSKLPGVKNNDSAFFFFFDEVLDSSSEGRANSSYDFDPKPKLYQLNNAILLI